MLETEKRFRCSEGPPRLTCSGCLFMQPTPLCSITFLLSQVRFGTRSQKEIFCMCGYLSNFAIGSLKFPFFSIWPFLLTLRFLFLSEIRKTSVRLLVPFAKNTTHPHPHHPPNDEIRLINTSVPKIKSWNCSITFFSSQTFCWDVMEIVTTK